MNKLLFVLIYTTLISVLTAQKEEHKAVDLAKAGNIEITSSEFKERFELTPWPKGHDSITSKDPQLSFLYTLIAEKLLAQKAQALGLDNSEEMKTSIGSLENMYVRDALYRHEIPDKVKIPAKSLSDAVQKNRYTLKIIYIHSSSEDEINLIYNALKNGASFDSVLASRDSWRKDSVSEVSFGQLNRSLEDAAYSLKEGEVSRPVTDGVNWFILKLIKKIDRLSLKIADRAQLVSEAQKIERSREIENGYQRFYKKFFRGKKVETDGFLFRSFSEKVVSCLQKKTSDYSQKSKLTLSAEDFRNIEKMFGPDSLNMIFIKSSEAPVRLKEFIYDFQSQGFFSFTTESGTIMAQLDSRVKKFIEGELLAREGYKRGLQNLPEVKRSNKMWRESFLAQLLKKRLLDSCKVSEDELKQGSMASTLTELPQKMINIVEILTDNLETVEIIFAELKKGADIKDLAFRYSKNESAKLNLGESGFFPFDSKGEIGRIASKMNIGDIYGPLKTEKGYSIFKLIGEKEKSVDTTNILRLSGEELRNKLLSHKYHKKLIDYTAGLAKNYGISIDRELLNPRDFPNMNIFAYRNMGFGGKMPAVPLTVPFTDWVGKWKENERSLP